MSTNNKTAGQRIKLAVEKSGKTNAQIAEKAKCSVGYFGAMVNEHAHLSTEKAEKVSKVLGIRLTQAEIDRHNAKYKRWHKGLDSSKPKSEKAPKASPKAEKVETGWMPDPSELEAVFSKPAVKAPKAPKAPKVDPKQMRLPSFDLLNAVAEKLAEAMLKRMDQSGEGEGTGTEG